MSKFSINGQITAILEPRQGKGYTIQEIEVTETSNFNGNSIQNTYRIGFKNQRAAVLQQFQPGQMVSVEGFINSVPKEAQPGQTFYNYYFNGSNIQPMYQQPQGYINPANGAQYPYQQPQQTYTPQAPYGQPVFGAGNGNNGFRH